jgi:hypothetical protein
MAPQAVAGAGVCGSVRIKGPSNAGRIIARSGRASMVAGS